ncbi:MAG: prepilin-type N-terminal cleavage/methylation domain-containing protein [Candidatus Paceibacterota bacterium]
MYHYKYQAKNKGLARRSTTEGFTLIELLVVISIISLLSSIVFASLTTARAKARDARRMQDLHTLEIVFQEYYNDNNGTYPSPGCFSTGAGDWDSTIKTALAPYISKLPVDPVSNSGSNYYAFCALGNPPLVPSHPCYLQSIIYVPLEAYKSGSDQCGLGAPWASRLLGR